MVILLFFFLLSLSSVASASGWCARASGAGCTVSGKRVAVVVLNDIHTGSEDDLSVLSHAAYTHRHGYDLYIERCYVDGDAYVQADRMSVNLAKPHLILKHLEAHDLVLYLDADTYFRDHDRTLEQYAADRFEGSSASILVSADCFDETFCWSAKGPNTGVILVKNTQSAVRALETWANAMHPGEACDESKNELYRSLKHHEQGCFDALMMQDEAFGDQVLLLPKDHREGFGSNDGAFITHVVGHYNDDRRQRMREALRPLVQRLFFD